MGGGQGGGGEGNMQAYFPHLRNGFQILLKQITRLYVGRHFV